LVLGLVILTVGLVIAKVVSVPILGNIFLIYGFTSIYLINFRIDCSFNNHTETQQACSSLGSFRDFYLNEWIIFYPY
jgi:ABC-2 type transport system permease protein